MRACCSASRSSVRRGRVPVARAFDRADALPHEDAGGVEAFEQRRVERVLRAHGVGADRLQLGDERVLVAGRERVAVAVRVLLDRGAVQPQLAAVEEHAPFVPGQLAQADARGVAALLADATSDSVYRFGWLGDHSAGSATATLGAECDGLSRARRSGRGTGRGCSARRSVSVALRRDRARRAVVAHVARRGARSPARRRARRARASSAIVGSSSSLWPIGRIVTCAVEPAPVEPRAVKALLALRAGVAPVDAHDERVRAGGERARGLRRAGRSRGGRRSRWPST